MFWLVISIIALMIGVFFSVVLHRKSRMSSLLMGYVVGFIGLLIFLEIMPHVVQSIGLEGWLWFFSGLVLVTLVDSVATGYQRSISLIVLSVTFGIHAFLDGIALGVDVENMLIMAVVAHRLPEGMAVGAKFKQIKDQIIVVGVMIIASIMGYFSVQSFPLESVLSLQALACGGLAHALLHIHGPEQRSTTDKFKAQDPSRKFWRVAGLLISILVFIVVLHGESSHVHSLDFSLLSVVTFGLLGLVYWERNQPSIE